jgi:hypothetical protein
MNAIRIFALAAAISLSGAAPASAAFLFTAPTIGGEAVVSRVDAASARPAAEDYFNYDALVTLGALCVAGGAMSAFAVFAAKRRRAEEAELTDGNWRDNVFAAIQADLAQFTESFRRAA